MVSIKQETEKINTGSWRLEENKISKSCHEYQPFGKRTVFRALKGPFPTPLLDLIAFRLYDEFAD
jgi:hypothetical protein